MAPKKIERLGARAGYDLWSRTYDSTPNPVVAMDSRHTIKLLSPQQGEAILDAGCGTGRNLKELLQAGSLPIGVDFSHEMLKVAQENYSEVPIALADLERPLPFRDESFDAVLCSLIGEHLCALGGVVQEFHRALRRGGRLVFSVYHPAMSAAGIEANFEQEGIEYRLGAFHYTVQEHVDLFESTGFANIVVEEFAGDETLVNSIPSAAKYLGFPVLLVLAANR
jgi:SAM-dependent methyltransferase